MTISRSDKELLDRIKRVQEQVNEALIESGRKPEELTVMAVTKTVPPHKVNLAVQSGIHLLGENRVQEYLSKREEYDLQNAQVHMIGHLQSNKVRQIIDKVSMIESVSSLKLAQEIDRQAQKSGTVMDVLLEINIGKEESKTGFFREEVDEALVVLSQLSHIRVKGMMCIPPKENTEKFFSDMAQFFIDIRDKKLDNINMSLLSMGMSGDYQMAIRYHSNIVRLGTALFGARDYPAEKG
jgi:pyridoxal phosphate enzyme (YggS family)